jgi:hypothetical protein
MEGFTPSRHEIEVLLARALTSAAFASFIDSVNEPLGGRFVVSAELPNEIESACAREAKLGEHLLRP